MRKLLGSLALGLVFTASALAANAGASICEKTGTIVETCCCVEKDGAVVCSLTGETVSSCCCVSAK